MDDNYALKELQNRNWPYFINRIIRFSQQGAATNVSEIGVSDRLEANILYNTRENFEIVRELYNELFNAVGVSLHELLKYMGIDERNRVDTDLTNKAPNEAYIQERILLTYRDFFYEHGRFPGNNTIVPIPIARIPSFIKSGDILSPLALYETYVGQDMRGIVSVQFLAALNFFLRGDSELSRDAMSELFHNLS